MRLPRLIQRFLDRLPQRETVMAQAAAEAHALTLVECLTCGSSAGLWWAPSLDGPEIHCMGCFERGTKQQIVKKADLNIAENRR